MSNADFNIRQNQTGVYVNTSNIQKMFGDLTGRQQKKAYRNVMRKAAGILSRQTRKNLKQYTRKSASRNWWNNKTLSSGVRVKIESDEQANVNIMGDFRLKFFELGTNDRYTRGNQSSKPTTTSRRYRKPVFRGKMYRKWFFAWAKQQTENQIFSTMDKMLSESIQKIANKT